MRYVISIAALSLLAACGEPHNARLQELPEMDASESAMTVASNGKSRGVDDSTSLFQPADLAFLGDSLVISEAGNNRLLIAGPTDSIRRSIGHEGEGPGELEQPLHVTTWKDRIAVAELTNARISIFGSNGRFQGTLPFPNGSAALATNPSGKTYAAILDSGYYAVEIDSAGRLRNVGPRATDLYARVDYDRFGNPRGAGASLLAGTDDSTLHVFDNEVGVLLKFSKNGRRLAAVRLPESVRKALLANRRRTVADLVHTGLTVSFAPLAKGMSVTDDGQLFLLFRTNELFGLLIDPTTYKARPLRLPTDAATARLLISAQSAVIHKGRVYALGADRLTVRPLEVSK